MKKWIVIEIILLVPALFLIGREVTSSQQTTPTFPGVSLKMLEEQLIFLTFPAQVEDPISETEARRAANFGGGLKI